MMRRRADVRNGSVNDGLAPRTRGSRQGDKLCESTWCGEQDTSEWLERRNTPNLSRLLTSSFVAHFVALCIVHVEEEECEISPTPLLTRLEKLARRLEEHIDGGIVLTRLLISGCKSPGFLVGLVRLPSFDEGQDSVEGLAG